MRKIITIRENLIQLMNDRVVPSLQVAEESDVCGYQFFDYLDGAETALNGEEIQRIFNYLNELK